MTLELDRRAFVSLAPKAALGLAALGPLSTLALPDTAQAASYGTNKNALRTCTKVLDITYNKAYLPDGKKLSIYDNQAMCLDTTNRRIYVTHSCYDERYAVVLSAPMSAIDDWIRAQKEAEEAAKRAEEEAQRQQEQEQQLEAGEGNEGPSDEETDPDEGEGGSGEEEQPTSIWTIVGIYGNSWLKHANAMTCVPTGKGTKLVVATATKNLRVIYIPNAANPSANVQTSTWHCKKFTPYAIVYDQQTRTFIARNGMGSSKGNRYFNTYTFKAPTTKTTGTYQVKKYVAALKLELPTSLGVNAGVFGPNATTITPYKYSKQDMAYGNGYLYVALSDTKEHLALIDRNGETVTRTSRNVVLRYKTGNATAMHKRYRYKKKKKKAKTYALDRAYFVKGIDVTDRGFEIEGLHVMGNRLYFSTNESFGGTPRQKDSLRYLTI